MNISKPLKQHDVVYCLPGSIENHKEAIWMRIRTENDKKHILTLKRSVKGHLDSIEYETFIDDANEMRMMLFEMGYELYSDLTKLREKGKYGDVELCLDTVQGLGTFIEAEKLVDEDEDGEAIRKELWQVFGKLGIDKLQEVNKGYDVLEREARKNSSNQTS